MSKKSVELFYDVVSPFSWFAFEVICRYQTRWNISLKFRPFFLGGVMQGSGNKPPAMVPNKSTYMFKEIPMLAKYYNVPLKFPKDPSELMFRKGTLSAQRFLTAVNIEQPQMVEKVSRELWMRAWNRDEDIGSDESLAETAKAVGLSDDVTRVLITKMKDSSIKDALKNTTQEALDLGAFGSPILVVNVDDKKEWVFGSDRFPILADMLGEKWEGPNPGVNSKL